MAQFFQIPKTKMCGLNPTRYETDYIATLAAYISVCSSDPEAKAVTQQFLNNAGVLPATMGRIYRQALACDLPSRFVICFAAQQAFMLKGETEHLMIHREKEFESQVKLLNPMSVRECQSIVINRLDRLTLNIHEENERIEMAYEESAASLLAAEFLRSMTACVNREETKSHKEKKKTPAKTGQQGRKTLTMPAAEKKKVTTVTETTPVEDKPFAALADLAKSLTLKVRPAQPEADAPEAHTAEQLQPAVIDEQPAVADMQPAIADQASDSLEDLQEPPFSILPCEEKKPVDLNENLMGQAAEKNSATTFKDDQPSISDLTPSLNHETETAEDAGSTAVTDAVTRTEPATPAAPENERNDMPTEETAAPIASTPVSPQASEPTQNEARKRDRKRGVPKSVQEHKLLLTLLKHHDSGTLTDELWDLAKSIVNP